jgi:hypothetical protein
LNTKEDFFLSEEAAEWIGLKKSEYLSLLIAQLSDDDFGFEEFHDYDEFIPQTIGQPDRMYQDSSGLFRLRTCMRTYSELTHFHHIVIGALIPDQDSGDEVFVPVLSFVTRKESLVRQWSIGEELGRPLLN